MSTELERLAVAESKVETLDERLEDLEQWREDHVPLLSWLKGFRDRMERVLTAILVSAILALCGVAVQVYLHLRGGGH